MIIKEFAGLLDRIGRRFWIVHEPVAKIDPVGRFCIERMPRTGINDERRPVRRVCAILFHKRLASRGCRPVVGIADEDLAVGKYVLDQAKKKKMKLRNVTEI